MPGSGKETVVGGLYTVQNGACIVFIAGQLTNTRVHGYYTLLEH